MKKLIACLGVFALATASSLGALGWYQDYVILSVDGGASGYYWVGSDPGYGTQFDTHDFGTVASLELTGADFRYWSDTQDRGGGSFFLSIDGGAATERIWTQSYLGGNDYQGLWSGSSDLLSGLNPGVHTASVWAKSWDTGSGQGDSWLSNGGANYKATFTVAAIPEPAVLSFLGLAVGIFAFMHRRQRRG